MHNQVKRAGILGRFSAAGGQLTAGGLWSKLNRCSDSGGPICACSTGS